jgi:hypothetical protein
LVEYQIRRLNFRDPEQTSILYPEQGDIQLGSSSQYTLNAESSIWSGSCGV